MAAAELAAKAKRRGCRPASLTALSLRKKLSARRASADTPAPAAFRGHTEPTPAQRWSTASYVRACERPSAPRVVLLGPRCRTRNQQRQSKCKVRRPTTLVRTHRIKRWRQSQLSGRLRKVWESSMKVRMFQSSGCSVQGSGCRAQGSGFRVRQGSGFRVQSSGCRVQGSEFRVQGSVFSVQSSEYKFVRVQGIGFRVQSLGCRVQGSGFRVQCSASRVQS